jgi:hypothetical protein
LKNKERELRVKENELRQKEQVDFATILFWFIGSVSMNVVNNVLRCA